jgi:hypothetical protein
VTAARSEDDQSRRFQGEAQHVLVARPEQMVPIFSLPSPPRSGGPGAMGVMQAALDARFRGHGGMGSGIKC